MESFEKVFSILDRAKTLGSQTLENGTKLIGPAPHVAPQAWLHRVYAPLSEEEITTIEEGIRRPLPTGFRNFLKVANGLTIFSDSLAIFGLRKNYVRTGMDVWQPYSIELPNLGGRPKDAKESHVFVGRYSQDGSHLFIDAKTSKTFRSKRYTAQPINEWVSFEEMLISETMRIGLLFDDRGKQIDPAQPRTPQQAGTLAS